MSWRPGKGDLQTGVANAPSREKAGCAEGGLIVEDMHRFHSDIVSVLEEMKCRCCTGLEEMALDVDFEDRLAEAEVLNDVDVANFRIDPLGRGHIVQRRHLLRGWRHGD